MNFSCVNFVTLKAYRFIRIASKIFTWKKQIRLASQTICLPIFRQWSTVPKDESVLRINILMSFKTYLPSCRIWLGIWNINDIISDEFSIGYQGRIFWKSFSDDIYFVLWWCNIFWNKVAKIYLSRHSKKTKFMFVSKELSEP